MKFEISRTSIKDDNKKPYKGAKRVDGKWFVDVEKIEDILAIGDVMIIRSPNKFNGFIPQLEIYDSWRE